MSEVKFTVLEMLPNYIRAQLYRVSESEACEMFGLSWRGLRFRC